MPFRPLQPKLALLACLIAILALGLPILQAQESAPQGEEGQEMVQARVQELSALSPAERRAELKKMTAEERREVWFELKKQQAVANGQTPPARGTGFEARPFTGPAGTGNGQGGDGPSRLVGAIQYDDGVITTSFGGGAIVGNRFDTALGNPILASGTISTVVGVVVPGPAFTTNSAGFVIEGPQTVGGGAMAIFSTFTPATGTVDTVTFAGLGVNYTGSSFMVLFGDFANSFIPAFGTGTTNGQGHHGIVGFTGGMGPNITAVSDLGGTLNGLIRVTGNVLPVELLSFDVD